MAQKFIGIESDSLDFFSQFDLISALNNWEDKTKVITIAAYLDGPAKSFYRKIFKDSINYDDLKKKFLEEFPPSDNYASKFYTAKQLQNETPICFLYRLEDLAEKANIKDEQIVISQFLGNLVYFYKRLFAAQIYSDLKVLKKSIIQFQSAVSNKNEDLNLPIKIKEIKTNNNQTHSDAGEPSPSAFSTPQPSHARTYVPQRTMATPTRTPTVPRPELRYNLRNRNPTGGSQNTPRDPTNLN